MRKHSRSVMAALYRMLLVIRPIKSNCDTKVEGQVEAMIIELELWSECLIKAVFESFPALSTFLTASDEDFFKK
jgi:hypothetical protein